MSGLKRTAKLWRENIAAGFTNTCNVTGTVGNKQVLNWKGTPTQRDDLLRTFPTLIRDKLTPGEALESCADAIIANIADDGMASNDFGRNVQSIAMLWRVFTTPLDRNDPGGVTYGDVITFKNLHVAFEKHEQPNDQFNVTWNITMMQPRADAKENRSNTMAARLGNVLYWTSILIAGAWFWLLSEMGVFKGPSNWQVQLFAYGTTGFIVLVGWALRYILRG
jgi:hypothetical protein